MEKKIDSALENFIKDFLIKKYGEDLRAVYGIGSSFKSDLGASDVDIVVLLKSLDKTPVKSYTTARFEKVIHNNIEVWFLYGTLDGYLDKNKFKRMSFANWEWSVRGIKYASVLLYGEEIRNQLPIPNYNYQDILIRVAYHLEPMTKEKIKWYAKERGKIIDEKLRLTKAIFKFGFFLTVVDYPEANIFDKKGVYTLLKKSSAEGLIGKDFVKLYELAMEYRQGKEIIDFENIRKKFMKTFIRETIAATENTWKGKDGIRGILKEGFGKRPFWKIINYIDKNGWM